MLHAARKNKTRLPAQRYAAWSASGEARRTQEDEITSTIFGPLDFMPQETVNCIINAIFQDSCCTDDDEISMELWPRIDRIEPDILFTKKSTDGSVMYFVIEVKWNAPLGETQVVDQIKAVRKERNPKNIKHMVLSRFSLPVGTLSENCTWMDFKERLQAGKKTYPRDDSIYGKWCELTTDFLEACNVRHFRGFGRTMENSICLPRNNKHIFWSGFDGWKAIYRYENLRCGRMAAENAFVSNV